MRFPHLAHRSAAAHKLNSTPQQDRMNLISGKGETSSRLPGPFSLFLPGSCPNNRNRRTIGTIGPEFCSGDAQKGRRSSRGLFIPAAKPLAAAQALRAISRRVTRLVKAAHFHAAYGVYAGTGMVVKPVAFVSG